MAMGRMWAGMVGVGLLGVAAGCMVPKGQLNTCQTQNRALTEKNAALQSEVENLRSHQEHLIRKLQQAEQEVALVRQENELIRRRLELKEQGSSTTDLAYGTGQMVVPAAGRLRLEQLAKRFPSLGLNPLTGQCQLVSERLFRPGQNQLAAEAESSLTGLAQLLQSPEGNDLRVWIVAGSAEQTTGQRPGQAGSASLGPLTAQQALALKEKLCQLGVPGSRIGLATVPTANVPANSSVPPSASQHLQVFLLPPEIPIVGWAGQQTQRF